MLAWPSRNCQSKLLICDIECIILGKSVNRSDLCETPQMARLVFRTGNDEIAVGRIHVDFADALLVTTVFPRERDHMLAMNSKSAQLGLFNG